jgi:Arm DNA-binding domain
MARASNRLTAVGIAKAKKPGMLPDGHGLYLRGGKSWIFRYKRAGTTHDVGLGPLHTASLADARLAALDLRKRRLMATIHWPPNVKRRRATRPPTRR